MPNKTYYTLFIGHSQLVNCTTKFQIVLLFTVNQRDPDSFRNFPGFLSKSIPYFSTSCLLDSTTLLWIFASPLFLAYLNTHLHYTCLLNILSLERIIGIGTWSLFVLKGLHTAVHHLEFVHDSYFSAVCYSIRLWDLILGISSFSSSWYNLPTQHNIQCPLEGQLFERTQKIEHC